MDLKNSKNAVILVFLICINYAYSQVYNYAPVIHNDIETNPAILASENMNDRVQLMQQNTFSEKNPFSYTSLRFSKYFQSCFSGVGLSINNTSMDNHVNYKHIGIGAGYRNILFNKVFIKLGACYKLTSSADTSISFDYYSTEYKPLPMSDVRTVKNNLNLSLSFSSASDRYYISLGYLNLDLPWDNSHNVTFPTYFVINVGNLMSIFRGDKNGRKEISYSAFLKHASGETTFNQYVNVKLNLPLTRRSSIQYGIRAGYAENDYFHLIPFLTYYKKKFALSLSYSYRLNKKNLYTKPYSTTQINIIYLI